MSKIFCCTHKMWFWARNCGLTGIRKLKRPILYMQYVNLEGPQAYVRGRAVGIALRNAARHAKHPL